MPATSAPSVQQLSSEERYRLLVNAVTDYAIYMLDPSGKVVSWNQGAERLKGYSTREAIGLDFRQFYTPEDRESGLPDRALAAAATAGRYEVEGWRMRKDGDRFWALVVIDPVRAADGSLLGYAKVTRDLSERRQAEEALRRSEQQFRMLVQSVVDYAIYMLDAEGRIVSWNAGAERIKGYAAYEVIGTHFSRFYRSEDQAQGVPAAALATSLREGRFEAEAIRVRKDGTEFHAHVVIDPIRSEDGQVMGFAKVTRDVTDRKCAQMKLEQAREALFQSQKLDAIGQLTGGVAHDFNNLLMVVMSSLELARRRLPNEGQVKDLLDNAYQAARRGATLTQRMLAFARRQELKPGRVGLAALVDGMMALLARSVGSNVEIDINVPAELPDVLIDAHQLELALLNLAVNARDAMPDGGHLKLSASEDFAEGGRYVRLSVRDSGVGMDGPTLARAMEPFFTTKGSGKGTGLGLSMVHGLAEQSGGRFVLSSLVGEGTTAALWLPVASEFAKVGDRPLSKESTIARRPSLLVLAVDDDSLVLNNTVALLQDLGHSVLQAESAIEALSILDRGHRIQLLVSDQIMPVMTGAQLMATTAERHGPIPAVLATGYAEEPQGLPAHVVRLAKPFDQHALAEALSEACARVGSAGRDSAT